MAKLFKKKVEKKEEVIEKEEVVEEKVAKKPTSAELAKMINEIMKK